MAADEPRLQPVSDRAAARAPAADSASIPARRRWTIRLATGAIVALHLALLVAALRDYRVSVDSAYHTALGRQYGEHLVYFWDSVHYAPVGRPNLQGPLVHFAIGMLGRALGGTGDDYVRANALLGVACWLGAVASVAFFAARHGGDRAALLAVAAFAGSAYASGSFYVNLPSGWMFVFTPWAIHFFLARRLVLAAIFGALACYGHLGGFPTVAIGLAVAGLLSGRWRDLAATGGSVAVLTAPYWIHFLRSLAFYVGQKGDTAWMIDPLVDAFWVIGVASALRAPRRSAFLLAWAAAPAAWLLQDPTRFILQSALPGAALGGVAISGFLDRLPGRVFRGALTTALVLLATLFPLGIPGVAAELSWLAVPYPRILDWAEMRTDAAAIRDAGLEDRLLWGYASYVPSAIAVWADTRGEKGHWVEVQPPDDPSDRMSVADKVFVLPLPPADGTLADWQAKGLVRVHGGGKWSAVVTFEPRPSIEEADALARAVWATEAAWIAANCERNATGDLRTMLTDPREVPRRTRERGYCRTRAARMAAAMLLYGYAREPVDPGRARLAAGAARGLGWMASLLGDESTLDFRTEEAHEQLRRDLSGVAAAARSGTGMDEAFVALLEHVAAGARGGLASRSAASARARALREAVDAPGGSARPAGAAR